MGITPEFSRVAAETSASKHSPSGRLGGPWMPAEGAALNWVPQLCEAVSVANQIRTYW
jgi:hypothetical protein